MGVVATSAENWLGQFVGREELLLAFLGCQVVEKTVLSAFGRLGFTADRLKVRRSLKEIDCVGRVNLIKAELRLIQIQGHKLLLVGSPRTCPQLLRKFRLLASKRRILTALLLEHKLQTGLVGGRKD